jgi:uncharacterized protein YegP (UPF0339 family)
MAQLDNYLPCEAYAAATESSKYAGFNAWLDSDTGSHYFAAVTNKGSVQLRSEAYTTESARDNGIESVMKNRDTEDRYKVVQDPADDQWYIVLRAGNNQEIARSCAYDSEAAAMAGIATCFSTYTERSSSTGIIDDYLPCETYAAAPESSKYAGFNAWLDSDTGSHYFAAVTNKGSVQLRSEAYTTESARDNGIESVMKNRDTEERYKVVQDPADDQWYIVLRAGNHQEIARSCAYDSEAAAMAGIATCFSTYTERSSSTGIIDDYLPCEAYAAAPESSKYAGFNAWLDSDTGSHYFAAVTNKGSVQLRSEAYTTESARDNGIESVMKNRDTEGRYKVVQDPADDQWYIVLRAGNHQEIARSCAYDSEAAAMAGIATCFSTYTERSSSTGIIEDYLPCEAYANKPAAADYEGFTQFQDETTGLHYFAMVDKNGHVVLKSEGYKTPASRDNGIESVIRNRDIEERWIKSKDDEGHYLSLRAGNHQEIARTCDFDSEGAMMGWWLPFAAAAYAWGRSDIEKAVPVAAVVEKISAVPTPPPAPPVVISTKKEAAAPPPPPVAAYREVESAAAAAGGSNWWKWLLPLLLLGLLWLLRGCDGCKTAEVPTPAVSVAPPPVAVDTVKTAAPTP